ncbi:hypothetical protein, partial [Klebsiella pneumoniae]
FFTSASQSLMVLPLAVVARPAQWSRAGDNASTKISQRHRLVSIETCQKKRRLQAIVTTVS